MNQYIIHTIADRPDFIAAAAKWFHEKWDIPLEAYTESMNACLDTQTAIPQWYIVMDRHKIIAGLGVIENDFHSRKDLTPNVCAVYVEPEYRCRGVAGEMLRFVCRHMKEKGIHTLYLLTDHKSFYERYGWKLLCMVQCDGGPNMTRMYIHEEK